MLLDKIFWMELNLSTSCLTIVLFLAKEQELKNRLIAVSLAATIGLVSLPAHADGGGILGAIAGGLLGAQVGQGNGRVAASALGAVIGYNAGQTYSRPYYVPPQQAYYPQQVYYPQQQVYYPPQQYYQPPPRVVYVPRWGDDDGYYRRWGDDD